jgi:hypothetical protein
MVPHTSPTAWTTTDRDVTDAEAVEQPDREAPHVHGEEAHRDVPRGAAHVHPVRLEEHGEGAAQAVQRRDRAQRLGDLGAHYGTGPEERERLCRHDCSRSTRIATAPG